LNVGICRKVKAEKKVTCQVFSKKKYTPRNTGKKKIHNFHFFCGKWYFASGIEMVSQENVPAKELVNWPLSIHFN